MGPREKVVPSATKSRQRSPNEYFWTSVLHAAKRWGDTSTAVADPESPSMSRIRHSLAPEIIIVPHEMKDASDLACSLYIYLMNE